MRKYLPRSAVAADASILAERQFDFLPLADLAVAVIVEQQRVPEVRKQKLSERVLDGGIA
jgi:hypothetical protein